MMRMLKSILEQQAYTLLFILIGIGYLFNLSIDVMDVDASQYASIAREMWESKSFLQVYHRGNDYLDKPPLLFWLSSLSMGVFGFNNVAYKLPAVLVLVLGIYSTYRFTLLYFPKRTALNAALLVACSNAFILISNDIRTDGMLSGFLIFAVWQLAAFLQTKHNKNFIWSAVGLGLAMLTKGPVALGIFGLGLGSDLLLRKQWKEIFHLRWLLFLVIVLLILSPMLYGLYQQFDLHPEKEAYGLQGPSGILFYFYTQSFGRLTGDIYWDNNTGPLFFLGSMMWDYQPIAILFIVAFFAGLWKWFRGEQPKTFTPYFGFLLPFIALSMSNYKLPHYIFPLLPFAAVIVCGWMEQQLQRKQPNLAFKAQQALLCLFPLLAIASFVWFFTPKSGFTLLATLPLILAFYYFRKKQYWAHSLAGFSTFLLLITSTYFYPSLERYQSTSHAGRAMRDSEANYTAFLNVHGHALDFYSEQILPGYQKGNVGLPALIYTDTAGVEQLKADFPQAEITQQYPHFHITTLRLPFLLRAQRATVTTPRVLVKIPKP